MSLDDLGTRYSSLQYISDLPIDVPKVDTSIIDKMIGDEVTVSVIKQ